MRWALLTAMVACNAVETANVATPNPRPAPAHPEGGAGGTAPEDKLGAPCAADSDCGGLVCLQASNYDVYAGGPAGGYCSKPCGLHEDCGENHACIQTGGPKSWCFRGCTPGEVDPLTMPKCLGRNDVACDGVYLGVSRPFCRPLCGIDLQCPADRHCEPSMGVCVPFEDGGAPLGSDCTDGDNCAGTCLDFSFSEIKVCSQHCSYGFYHFENYDCGGPDRGHCGYIIGPFGYGDLAMCASACDSHADCRQPDFWCRRLPQGGTRGYCFDAPTCTTGCADAMLACVDTPGGKRCVDPFFSF